MRGLTLLAASFAVGFAVMLDGASAGAAMIDSAFTETLVTTVPTGVTSMAWAPDGSGRLFLTRRTGDILIVQGGALLETPFVGVTPVYPNVTETGLLGLDFDPDFSSNGWLYVFVTVSATEQQIVRYTANGDVGEDPTVIVSGLPTRGRNHNGGGIGFGPDGKLYWAVGDNGNGTGVNDDLASMAAKVSRAERDGSVPSDNPFADGAGPNADYIWARGVRNPFTLTWQPTTERLWVNVVGTRYEQVFVLEAGDHAGWNLYDSTQPAGFVTPAISYPTNGPVPFVIVAGGAKRAAGVATFTTQVVHRLHPGVRVTVAGVTDTSFIGSAIVTSVLDPKTFSFAQAGPDATSGGGTVSGPDIGGCITGGTFFDSTGAPEEYRGNYFFGDYNSGRIERAQLDPTSNAVVSVDHWAQGLEHQLDMAVGPDGDLYYVVFGGALYHARYKATEQSLVISRQHVRLAEGGRLALSVRLALQPVADVTVAVARVDGDTDVTVEDSALVFDSVNWATPQPMHILAAEDSDITDDVATLRFTAQGLSFETATARVTDNDLVEGAGGGGGEGGGSSGSGGETQGDAGQGGVLGAGGEGETARGGGDDGTAAAGGAEGSAGKQTSDSSDGCGCRVGSVRSQASGWLLLFAAWAFTRRRGRLTV